MKNGAYDYLLKPFDPDELMVLIEKIIKHQAERRARPSSSGSSTRTARASRT
ncbi:MAG: hypothetical protein MZV70_44815 [Desulfobacterales bacterium]|nr:hypothetical protein [Desulfobacterales bacterium]